MINLTFNFFNETMNFSVSNREVHYKDKVWAKGIRCIPKDEEFVKKILMMRNKVPSKLITMFNLSKEDQAEYDNAKTDEELAQIIIKDCSKKGVKLIKREDK